MKTRSQTTPKPLNTVRLPPVESPRTRPRPKPKPETRKKGALGDLRRPKKPPTAFFYFMEDFRKTFQEENPSVKAMQDVGKACGEKWNKMAFEEKVKYYDLATERRAEFEKAMAQYNKKKVSVVHINGELSEESE
uniref:HMG1/2-like protein n=1 Tax=Aegilops tauschii TaxID=37682 RepID=M8BQG1_AEGTA